jgi:hypothetical protein
MFDCILNIYSEFSDSGYRFVIHKYLELEIVTSIDAKVEDNETRSHKNNTIGGHVADIRRTRELGR